MRCTNKRLFRKRRIINRKRQLTIRLTCGALGIIACVFAIILLSRPKNYVDKYELKGGIVRQDKQSGELCICTENYSEDIKSDAWVLLSQVL